MAGPCRAAPERALTVVVSGDVTIDWNLAREPLAPGRAEHDTRASWQRGGAALLADLLETVVGTLPPAGPSARVHPVEAPTDPLPPGDDALNHSYALWSRFPREAGDKGPATAWRVRFFLGVDAARTDEGVRAAWRRLELELPEADLVVLDDAGLGFRDRSDPELWRRAFGERRPWVVLKQSRPVAQGPLWEHLLAEAPDRLVVILKIDDLRGREVQVSRALSWERTAQDLFRELVFNPTVNALSRIAHTVVSLGPAGAALLSGPGRADASPTCTLLFDPERVEGAWESSHPGWTMGGTDCLTAALAREILLDPDEPRLDRGIQSGVAAARRLHEDGYWEQGPGRLELGFPLAAVAEEMQAGREPLQRQEVPDRHETGPRWTILEDRCRVGDLPAKAGDLLIKATDIAIRGPEEALEGVPLGRFGHLVTADRSEIEAFRSIATLIEEYVRVPQTRPLSIGIFGPPGSGKSFGVKQVAAAVGEGRVGQPLEFNLAQLGSPDDLADAFHQVRDRALSGEIPLVFWDEFDSALGGEPLGWLRYFLAPMQDGEFRQGQLTHPVGRSIFVFAGGTCERVEDLLEEMRTGEAKRAKLPDFVSRLKGYVNVLGPNPQGEYDPYAVVRRAVLLRSILERSAEGLFEEGVLRIDPGVLRALLETSEYRHGARSMEAVVGMSRLSDKRSFERSSLPPEPQLDLHVRAEEFLALVQQPQVDDEVLETLARAAHEVYREGMRRRGESSDALVHYDDLDELKKEQNRRNVRDIPAKLERVGCVRVPAGDTDGFAFTAAEVELLAREEHDRWMRDLGPGWRGGEHTYKTRKIHEAYLPWEDLPEEQKSKDRDLVREIPAILERAGCGVARTRPPAVAIGVTGHRVLAEVERIEAGLDEALRFLEESFPGEWTVVSGLAEGADRLVARRLLTQEDTRLVAVLPLEREDYEGDFETEASRREFEELLGLAGEVVRVPPQPSRDEAYEAGGRAVLARADVIVAIWDGQGAQGVGGTGGIVAEARERGIPLLWVHAGNRKPGTVDPTSLREEQGDVTYERIR